MMWSQALGAQSKVYGVDIDPHCEKFQDERVRVLIGDQGDRLFWKHFKDEVGAVDIIVDDGSHAPSDQIVTFEELWPVLKPNGVYICEDVHGKYNEFFFYVTGLAGSLHSCHQCGPYVVRTVPAQAEIERVSIYPFCIVIKKRPERLDRLVASRLGSSGETAKVHKVPGTSGDAKPCGECGAGSAGKRGDTTRNRRADPTAP